MSFFDEPTAKYPLTPLVTRLVGTPEGNVVQVCTQEVDQIVEECRYFRNYHPRNGMNQGRFRQLVARLPSAVIAMLFKRGMNPFRAECDREMVRWLNSSEAAPWRTSSGDV